MRLKIDIEKAIEIAEWYNGKKTVLKEIAPVDSAEQANKLYINKKKKKCNPEKYLYRKEFKQNRGIVLILDNYQCRECKSSSNLHVHHIKEKSQGGTNDINNLITLCEKCHAEKHKGENIYKLMSKVCANE
jgi:hypothetical protein